MVIIATGLVLLFVYAALIGYYYVHWLRLKNFQPATATGKLPFLTLLIPARNEADRIGALLQAIGKQTLAPENFEVIVINDYSTDDTEEKTLASGLTNMMLICPEVPEPLSSKKKAIEAGINKARGELIVTTDADCTPSPEWLRTLLAFYVQHDAAFIAAPVKYRYDRRFIERFQSLDFLVLQGITAAAVHSGLHTMCNGANLAYQLDAFKKVHGFEGIDQVATGDDMLLMYKIRQQYPGKVHYLRSYDAIVETAPMKTWKEFFSQRKRWASKTPVFDDRKVQVILLLVYLLHLVFPVMLVAGFWHTKYFIAAGSMLVIKTVIEFPFVRSVAKFYGEERLLPFFPLFQPLHIFYTILTGILSQGGRYEWKGRKTK